MSRKPRKQYQMSIDKYTIVESSQLMEIMIIMGIKDQYLVEWA
jgi:hypothetical protein